MTSGTDAVAPRARLSRLVTRFRVVRIAVALVRDLRFLLPGQPRLALVLARAAADGSTDAALLPLVDRAMAVRRASALLYRRARILDAAGELTAARAAWQELADRGVPLGTIRVRMITGRLAELEPGWLPTVAAPHERLEPVSRRRILHIAKSSAPERWSGFTIRTLQNLRAQREAGLDPVMMTEIGWPRQAGITSFEPVLTYDGFEHHRLDRGPAYDPTLTPNDIRLTDNVEAMAPVIRTVRPAILHAHSGYRGGEHALIALALRAQFDIPVVYEVRGLFEAVWSRDPVAAERSEQYRRRLAMETRILGEVDGVVAISEALTDELVSRGIPRGKITVVPNGIDEEALVATERDPGLRAMLGLDDAFVVGYLGNLDHWREGIDVLISAAAELRSRGRNDVAILVVGDGQRRAELEAHARRLHLADRVRFTGRVPHEQVAQYYRQMDLFANPRVDERAARLITPLKPYEAMALGVPVLVSDLPALREIVDPPHRGAIAPPGDPGGLADAIERLMDDPGGRARAAADALAWVRSERTWASNGPRYRAAYEAILGPIA